MIFMGHCWGYKYHVKAITTNKNWMLWMHQIQSKIIQQVANKENQTQPTNQLIIEWLFFSVAKKEQKNTKKDFMLLFLISIYKHSRKLLCTMSYCPFFGELLWNNAGYASHSAFNSPHITTIWQMKISLKDNTWVSK